MKEERKKILFVSSEVVPFAKTGGLADVAGSLPQELKELGHDVRVVMPEYSQISDEYLVELEHKLHFRTKVGWRDKYVGVNSLENNGVTTYFIDNKNYFDSPTLYEGKDKHIRFAYFCRAVLEMLPKLDFQPDIIHCNDWQTGPLSMMLKENYQIYDFYKDIKTVYTIHNLRYQGIFGRDILEDTLALDSKHWISGVVRHDGCVNYMKMGINMSDVVNTVSKTYAQEIKTPYFGEGLDYVMRMNDNDLYGIVNGIDYDDYNPATDEDIYDNYSADDVAGKLDNKLALQKEMGLPQREDVPVIGLVSRLVDQKGLDLLACVLDDLLQEDLQFVLLGTGADKYEKIFSKLGNRYPDKMTANIKYDGALARKIYASSDMFLMPSKFEPCGLGQLISLRYGTIPVVRETGGLNDTIQSYDEDTGQGNGFSFTNYNAHDMLFTIRRAVDFYYNQPKVWNKLVNRAMTGDYSWKNSAKEYLDLYDKLTAEDSKERKEEQELYKEEVTRKVVNINQVNEYDLKQLPGVGPALAKRIVQYRKQNGAFANRRELKKVSGIGSSLFQRISDNISC
ncbi:glycogen synthase GlgA [Halanaerocella petrolearia]